MMRQKVTKIVAAKSFTDQGLEGISQLLEIVDMIDKDLTSFKLKFKSLKE